MTKAIREIENDGSLAYWDRSDRDANPYDEGTPEPLHRNTQ